jgi:hypothetical protein
MASGRTWQAMRAKAGVACCSGVAAQRTRYSARRHSSAPSKAIPRYQQGSRDLSTDPVGHAWARRPTHQ